MSVSLRSTHSLLLPTVPGLEKLMAVHTVVKSKNNRTHIMVRDIDMKGLSIRKRNFRVAVSKQILPSTVSWQCATGCVGGQGRKALCRSDGEEGDTHRKTRRHYQSMLAGCWVNAGLSSLFYTSKTILTIKNNFKKIQRREIHTEGARTKAQIWLEYRGRRQMGPVAWDW